MVRAFNLAWPPLAYSIRDDDEAKRTYAFIVTYFLLLASVLVLALSLEARWVARALAAPEFFESYKAVPLVSTGVTLYALFLVLVVVIGRVGRTEFNFPVTAAAAGVNVGLNLILVPPHGMVGAGIALVGLVPGDAGAHVPGDAKILRRSVPMGAPRADRRPRRRPCSRPESSCYRHRVSADSCRAPRSCRSTGCSSTRAVSSSPTSCVSSARCASASARSRAESAEAPQDLEALQRRTELMEDMHET